MYIKQTDSPLPTFKTDSETRIALAVCTAGIALFGVCSCIYDWLFATSAGF
jgi:NADH-quinone oxidoreductase subunit N